MGGKKGLRREEQLQQLILSKKNFTMFPVHQNEKRSPAYKKTSRKPCNLLHTYFINLVYLNELYV